MSNTSPDSPEFNPNPSEPSANPPEISSSPPAGQEAAGSANAADRFRQTAQSRQEVGDESEQDLWEGRYSAKAMYGSFILAALVSVAILVGAITFGLLSWWMLWGGVIVVIWCVLLGMLFYKQLSRHYLLTSQRFIHETGILKRTTDRIEVIDIDDVTFQQGLVERMFGVGAIKITSSDRSHPELWLVGIESVKEVADTIDDVRRAERRRRGLHIEAI
jgi:membrane protein YdbS with pleckstrin-like domain